MKRKTIFLGAAAAILALGILGILVLKNPTLFGLKSHTGMTGDHLPDKYQEFLSDSGIISEGETVLYFYSPGMFGFKSDGNILTDKRVISYWETEGERHSRSAPFSGISGFAVHRKGGMKHDTILAVETVGRDPLVLFLSGREKWDEDFIAALAGKINNPSGYRDEKKITEGQYRDPDEMAVPDLTDLKYLAVKCSHPDLVLIEVGFYAMPEMEKEMMLFSLYISADGDNFPEYSIGAYKDEWVVARGDNSGVFTEFTFMGTPEISGDVYRMTVPWETLFGKRTGYTLYSYTFKGNDRLPNEGSLVFETESCRLSWLWHPYLAWMERE